MTLVTQLMFLAFFASIVLAIPAENDETSKSASPIDDDGTSKYYKVDDVPQCNQKDENLGECMKRTMNIMWPRLRDGVPELNIAPYEPFVMNRTTFQYTNGPVSGRITVKRMEIHGFSNYKFNSVDAKFNKDKMKMRTVSFLPKMNIVGQYKADMMFNTVHVKPKGEFNVTLLDVEVTTRVEGEVYSKNGHRFMRFTSLDTDPKIGDLKIKANGIFPDPELDELVLSVANEYWRDVYRIMLPETRQYWQPLVLKVINEVLKVMPIESFLKD